MGSKAESILASYNSRANSILSDYGLDDLSKKKKALQADADRFSSYINSGKYNTNDQRLHRNAMTAAVTDLDQKMSQYEKSSDEYKLYDTYRNYFNNALTTLDRTDVGVRAMDYVKDQTWHDANYRKEARDSLSASIDGITSEMNAIEDKNSSEYKQLAGYKDWYTKLYRAYDERDKFDSRFETADDYVAYTKSSDYDYTTSLQNNIDQAKEELRSYGEDPDKEKKPAVTLGFKDKVGTLAHGAAGVLENVLNNGAGGVAQNTADLIENGPAKLNRTKEEKARIKELKAQIETWQADLDRTTKYQDEALVYNNPFDINADYDKKISEIEDLLDKATTTSDRAKLEKQLQLFRDQQDFQKQLKEDPDALQKEIDNLRKQINYNAEHGKGDTENPMLYAELEQKQAYLTSVRKEQEAYKGSNLYKDEIYSGRGVDQDLYAKGEEAVRKKWDTWSVFGTNKKEAAKETTLDFTLGGERREIGSFLTEGLINEESDLVTAAERDAFYRLLGTAMETNNADDIERLMDYSSYVDAIAANRRAEKHSEKLENLSGTLSGARRWLANIGTIAEDKFVGGATGAADYLTSVAAFGLENLFGVEGPGDTAKNLSTAFNYMDMRDQLAMQSLGDHDPQGKFWQNFLGTGQSVSQFIGEGAGTIANMLPGIIAGRMVADTILAGIATDADPAAVLKAKTSASNTAKLISSSLLGGSAASSSYRQTREQGYDEGQALLYGGVSGLTEAASEYWVESVAGRIGIDEGTLMRKVENIANAKAKFFAQMGVRVAGEALEEYAQNKVEYLLNDAILNQYEDFEAFNEEDWHTILSTAFSTGLLEAGGSVITGNNAIRFDKTGKLLSTGEGLKSKSETEYRKTLAAAGEVINGSDNLKNTLIYLASEVQPTEIGDTVRDMAERMESGSLKATNSNLGQLAEMYLAYEVEQSGARTKAERAAAYNLAAAKLFNGARAYKTIEGARAESEAARKALFESSNADPTVRALPRVQSDLRAMDGTLSLDEVQEAAQLANYVSSGSELTEAQMAKVTGDTKVGRVVRSWMLNHGGEIRNDMSKAEMQEAVQAYINNNREILRNQKELGRTRVVNAALDAANRIRIQQATEANDIQPRVAEKRAAAFNEAQANLANAERNREAVDLPPSQAIEKITSHDQQKAATKTNKARLNEIREETQELQHELKALQNKAKVPSKQDRARIQEINNQIRANAAEVQQIVTANAAEVGNPNVFSDPITGVRITRENYVQGLTAKGVSAEEANAQFDQLVQQANAIRGGEDTNERKSSGESGERTGVDKSGNRGENQERGDRSESGNDSGRNGTVSEIRGRAGKGGVVARISAGAKITDGEHASELTGQYNDIETLTDTLKKSGFKKIVYIAEGQLLNNLGESVPAMYLNGELYLRLDYNIPGYSYTATAEHERTHLRLDLFRTRFGSADTQNYVTVALNNILSEDTYKKAFLAYADKYARLYRAGADVAAVGHMINEEILCDIVGGINNFDQQLGDYQDSANEFFEDSKFNSVTRELVENPTGNPGDVAVEQVSENAMPHNLSVETVEEAVQDVTNSSGETVATTSDTGQAVFSLRTYDEGGRDALDAYLTKQVKKGALDKTDADDIRSKMEQLYDLCQKFNNGTYEPFSAWSEAEIVNIDGRPVFSVVKANGEYKLNLDFSLVCKKRRALDAVFNEMIARGLMNKVVGDKALLKMEPASIAHINDIIREHGFETACALCFVDSKRFRMALIADAFVSMYNEQVNSLLEGSDKHATYFNYGGDRTLANNAKGEGGIETLQDFELNWTKVNDILENGKKGTVEWKIANYLKNNPQGRKLMSRGDLMSTAGFDALNATNPELLSLYNAKKGAGGPKAVQSDVQYLNDVINTSSFNKEAAYAVGGVRIQSFSDYIGRLVFDYIQMAGDLAAKELPAHAYTKEYMFAEQFGLTGIKINMSLVPAVLDDGVAPGLDKDGNYAWKDGQSFGSTVYDNKGKRLTAQEGFLLAIQIQNADGYSKNCGTIAVGVSDAHILKMLDDPNIRMIIPYHKSSINHLVAAMNQIDKYQDYTLEQNTRVKNEKGEWVRLSPELDFNWNSTLQEMERQGLGAREAAQAYKNWCAEHGYLPKFDRFAWNKNYYKLLEDFTAYDKDGTTPAPLGPVQMNFPTESDAFGSMESLIKSGLEEDAMLQAKQDAGVAAIVDEIERDLPAWEERLAEEGEEFAIRSGRESLERTKMREGEARFSLRLHPEHLAGVNIADDELLGTTADGLNLHYTDLILRRMKTIETRDTPSLGLKKNNSRNGKRISNPDGTGGEEVALISTNNKDFLGVPMVVGYATYGEPKKYTSYEQFRADYDKHKVPKGSKYDMKPGQVKYGYPILSVRAEPNPYRVTTSGIVFRDAERSEQADGKKAIEESKLTSDQYVDRYGEEAYNKRGWATVDGGPLTGIDAIKWNSDFAAKRASQSEGQILSWVEPEKEGKSKIIVADGSIEDPAIERVITINNAQLLESEVRNIYEVLNEKYAEREWIISNLADEEIIVVNNRSDSRRANQSRESRGSNASSTRRSEELRNGRGSSNSSENSSNESVAHFSLQNLESPIEPTSNAWQRDHTTAEVKEMYPGLWDITADESEVRNPTQVKDTVKTYRKIYDILKAEGFNGKILDASSGLGYGTQAGREEYGFEVEDIEPYPDKSYTPQYTDYDSLNKKYDAIISNAVLNVLPQDQRDALVVKMGELLNPGGRIFINVRGDDVNGNKSNQPVGGKWEYYVASTGSYQKGFTKPELVAYLKDALGPGFTVEPTSKYGKTSAIVTKEGNQAQLSAQQTAKENLDRLKGALNELSRADRDAGWTSHRGPRSLSKTVVQSYTADQVRGEADRKAVANTIRSAGGISQEYIATEDDDLITVDVVSPDFYTKEMLEEEAANKEHGYETKFYSGNPVFSGGAWNVAGFADDVRNVIYIKIDAPDSGRFDIMLNNIYGDKLADLDDNNTVTSIGRHERFHLLVNAMDDAARALKSYVNAEENSALFDDINRWYQLKKSEYGYSYEDYGEELAADFYANSLTSTDEEASGKIQQLVSQIDAGTEHGARYSLQADPEFLEADLKGGQLQEEDYNQLIEFFNKPELEDVFDTDMLMQDIESASVIYPSLDRSTDILEAIADAKEILRSQNKLSANESDRINELMWRILEDASVSNRDLWIEKNYAGEFRDPDFASWARQNHREELMPVGYERLVDRVDPETGEVTVEAQKTESGAPTFADYERRNMLGIQTKNELDNLMDAKRADAKRGFGRNLKLGQPKLSIQPEENLEAQERAIREAVNDFRKVGEFYPEDSLERDLLNVMSENDAQVIGDWINQKIDEYLLIKNEGQPVKVMPFTPRMRPDELKRVNAGVERLIEKYGAIPAGDQRGGRARQYLLPKQTTDTNKVHKHVQQVGEAKSVNETAKPYLNRFVLTDVAATYAPSSNADDMAAARKTLDTVGLRNAIMQFEGVANNMDIPTTKTVALGEQLLVETAAAGDMGNFLKVLASVCEMSGQLGKSLQAFSILKKAGPVGQLYYIQKVVDRMNNKTYVDQITRGKMAPITIDQADAQAILTAATEDERQQVMDRLMQKIADQVPVTMVDRWNTWRYLAMLGNPRTHIRNLVGNGVFVPMLFAKDLIASIGEFVATKTGIMDAADRTKNAKELLHIDPNGYRALAKEDALANKQLLQGNGKYNPASEIMEKRKVLPGFLDKVSRFNTEYLEKEDWAFLERAYVSALSQALANTGLSVDQLQTTEEGQRALNEARNIAVQEAQRSTYRDFSATAAALNRFKQIKSGKGRFAAIALEGVVPFTKTPINILKRGIEFSPIGIATGLAHIAQNVTKGKYTSASQIIDELASGLTGTGVAVLGAILSRLGWIRGKDDDEKQERFDKLQGYQDYALKIGNQTFTIDWAAPTALPLFTGVAANELIEGDESLSANNLWDAVMMIAEPMMSLSMLDGINTVLNSASYAPEDQKVATIAKASLSSYFGQALPTILGQAARSIDGTQRATYIDKNSKYNSDLQRFWQQNVMGKIPGLEQQKIPYVDQWGRTKDAKYKLLSTLENFLAPWYRSEIESTPLDDELQRLYDSVTDTELKGKVLPTAFAKDFSVNKQTYNMSAEEYVSYAKEVGQTNYAMLSDVIYDPRYRALTDDQKAKALDYFYKYSRSVAAWHVNPDYNIHGQGKWIEDARDARTQRERENIIWDKVLDYIEDNMS